jgi:hypothetical protein
MILRLAIAAVLLAALSSTAAAEPVSAGITGLLLATGGFAGVPGIATAISISELLVSASLTVGLSLGLAAIAQRGGNAASGINSPAVRGAVKQANAAQRILFGRTRTSGVCYLYEVKPPKLYLGLVYSSLPIPEIGRITVEEKEVIMDRAGSIWTPLSPPFRVGAANRIRVAMQAGAIDQPVNPLIAEVFPELGADFRLPGLANAVWEFDYGANFDEFQALWGQVQIPNPLIETVQGAPVFDPRRPLQRWPDDWRDPADVADAIGTWQSTRNAALIQAFWRAAPFGLNAGYDGTDWDRVARAADWDDKAIALKDGGFIARGTIDGVVALDQRPNDVMEGMLTANRGFQVRRAGKGWIEPARPEDPLFTITDAMIAGQVQFRRDRPKRDRRNVGRAMFVAPERQYTEVHAPFYVREDLVAADGEELETTVRLPFTTAHQNAQRLIKELVEESLLERTLSITCSMHAFGVREGTVVRVDSRKYPHWNGIYQCEEWRLADDRRTVSFSLVEYDKTISVDWNPSTDEQEFVDLVA